MYPERLHHQQSGAGLPVALFVITVLALLVIGMAQLQESSSKAVSLQIQSQRAFFAAESGAQVAVARLIAGESCPAAPITFAGAGLSACSVSISCTGSDTFKVVSTGNCGSGADLASRTVEVSLR